MYNTTNKSIEYISFKGENLIVTLYNEYLKIRNETPFVQILSSFNRLISPPIIKYSNPIVSFYFELYESDKYNESIDSKFTIKIFGIVLGSNTLYLDVYTFTNFIWTSKVIEKVNCILYCSIIYLISSK